MDSGSVLTSNPKGSGSVSGGRRRRHYRHGVVSLAYVRLDHANGGIIRNVSPSGMAIQAVGPLQVGQVIHLRFELLKPRVRVETAGQVTWADSAGQAGIRFVDLPPRPYRLLKDWILTDLLAAASELALARAPIFAAGAAATAPGLVMSPPPLRPILLAPPADALRELPNLVAGDEPQRVAEMPIRLAWWPADIAPGTLAGFIDSLIIVSAVLLFSVVFVATIGEFPSWLLAGALALGSGGVFGWLYRYLFRNLAGATVGWRMARLAAEDMEWVRKLQEDDSGPRFR
jgi:PilZ domain-containing protein